MAQVLHAALPPHPCKTEYRDRAGAVLGTFSGEVQRNFFPLFDPAQRRELAERALQSVLVGTGEAIAPLRRAGRTFRVASGSRPSTDRC
jgi:hypothetical protein